jgi:hypothetical protein
LQRINSKFFRNWNIKQFVYISIGRFSFSNKNVHSNEMITLCVYIINIDRKVYTLPALYHSVIFRLALPFIHWAGLGCYPIYASQVLRWQLFTTTPCFFIDWDVVTLFARAGLELPFSSQIQAWIIKLSNVN